MTLSIDEGRLIEFAKSIEIIGSKVLEGLHRSRRGGEGLEFHSLSSYSYGEDAKRIDWKRYAASDRLYVRKFEREEKTAWTFLVDSSESMAYGSKRSFACQWAAAQIFLAKCWSDPWTLAPDIHNSMEEAFLQLSQNQAGLPPENFSSVEGSSDCHLILLSDTFFEKERLIKSLNSWRENFKKIHLIQVLDEREARFSFSNVLRFEDLESDDKLTLDSKAVKKLYLKEFQEHQNFVRDLFQKEGSFSPFVVGEKPIEDQLLLFFEGLWSF